MTKWEVTLHTFCDACVNGRTCKGTCKRMQTMEKLVLKHEKLSSAFDVVCDRLSKYENISKDEIKENLLKI